MVLVALIACVPGDGPVPGTTPTAPTTGPPTTTEGTSGGQSGSDGSGLCTSTEPAGLAEGPSGPFGREDVASLASGPHTGPVTWDDGGASTLTLDLTWDGEARLVDVDCDGVADRVVRFGTAVASTADGRLDGAEGWAQLSSDDGVTAALDAGVARGLEATATAAGISGTVWVEPGGTGSPTGSAAGAFDVVAP